MVHSVGVDMAVFKRFLKGWSLDLRSVALTQDALSRNEW